MRYVQTNIKAKGAVIEVNVDVQEFGPYDDGQSVYFDWCAAAHVARQAGYDVDRCLNNTLIVRNGESGTFILENRLEKFKADEPEPAVPAVKKDKKSKRVNIKNSIGKENDKKEDRKED